MPEQPLPIVVLISGSGSNLQALIDATADTATNTSLTDKLPVEIRAVISNRPNAKGLERAQQAGIHTEILDHTQFASREDFDQALQKCIDRFEPGLVVLAGFMRLLSNTFVDHYLGRMLNIHPSLLPEFKGLNTHQRALESGNNKHGASIHFVTPELDGGPVILQATVPVQPNDTPETLAARVLIQEHQIYPTAIRWFAEGRLRLHNNQIWLDDQILSEPVAFEADANGCL